MSTYYLYTSHHVISPISYHLLVSCPSLYSGGTLASYCSNNKSHHLWFYSSTHLFCISFRRCAAYTKHPKKAFVCQIEPCLMQQNRRSEVGLPVSVKTWIADSMTQKKIQKMTSDMLWIQSQGCFRQWTSRNLEFHATDSRLTLDNVIEVPLQLPHPHHCWRSW